MELLNPEQFCVRKDHCTTHHVCKVTDKVFISIYSDQITSIVFLELEKALSTIYTNALISKLQKVNVPIRQIQIISAGVPQGT